MTKLVPIALVLPAFLAGAERALALPALLPAALIPAQVNLPDPWGVLKALLLLTFFIHLLLVNILIGSTLLTLARRCLRPQPPGFKLGHEISFYPIVLALAVNFGVAPYLFTQVLYGSFLYSSSVLMAVWWLSATLFVMLAYYGLYIAKADHSRGLPRSRLTLVLAGLLLLCTAFVMSNNSTLMLRPEYWSGWFASPGGTMLNLGDPIFLPRYLHIIIGSLAVGGLVLAWRARRKTGSDTHAEVREGLVWFFSFTALQIPVGIWFLLAQPGHARAIFLGGDAIATTAFCLAMTGLAASLVFSWRGRLKETLFFALSLFMLMVIMRDMLRDAMLQPYPAPLFAGYAEHAGGDTLPLANGQDAALVLFLACALLAAALIAWLGRVAVNTLRPTRNGEGREA